MLPFALALPGASFAYAWAMPNNLQLAAQQDSFTQQLTQLRTELRDEFGRNANNNNNQQNHNNRNDNGNNNNVPNNYSPAEEYSESGVR